MHRCYVVRCGLFEVLPGVKGVEPLSTHFVEFFGAHYTAILFWEEESRLAKGYLLGCVADLEHRMVWVVDTEDAALLETWIVLPCHLTLPALAATAVLAVVHRAAVMPMAGEEIFLA